MKLSNIDVVIYRGKDERRESLIQEQLASGLLKFHPDLAKPKRVSAARTSIEERLSVALAFAEFGGSSRALAKITDRSSSFILVCKNEYLSGELGETDDDIIEKLGG